MSAIDVIAPARPRIRAAGRKARCRDPKPRVTPQDRLGLVVLDVQETAEALLKVHGGDRGCVLCYAARGCMFGNETGFSIVDCHVWIDDAPLLWKRVRPRLAFGTEQRQPDGEEASPGNPRRTRPGQPW
jgi:hypothetical protein